MPVNVHVLVSEITDSKAIRIQMQLLQLSWTCTEDYTCRLVHNILDTKTLCSTKYIGIETEYSSRVHAMQHVWHCTVNHPSLSVAHTHHIHVCTGRTSTYFFLIVFTFFFGGFALLDEELLLASLPRPLLLSLVVPLGGRVVSSSLLWIWPLSVCRGRLVPVKYYIIVNDQRLPISIYT